MQLRLHIWVSAPVATLLEQSQSRQRHPSGRKAKQFVPLPYFNLGGRRSDLPQRHILPTFLAFARCLSTSQYVNALCEWSSRCCQTNANRSSFPRPQLSIRPRDGRATLRGATRGGQVRRRRSVGKWLSTEAHFCNVGMRPKRNLAPSRRRNERCEFSARLFSQRPISR